MVTDTKIDDEHVELLRLSTCGSVDDGKSTLIGRLLYDSKSIFEDQLEALERSSDMSGEGNINLANLTDGLRAEREQGITIDVAYRYFATPRRKFIIADTPGHIQYTRNMVTGASTANLAILLIDARKGVIEQTRRHAYISSLLGIPHLVVCVNKMDLVDYSEEVFDKIHSDFTDFATRLNIKDIGFIPVSALVGDNIVDHSSNMPWYKGSPLLAYIEDLHIANDRNLADARFPVQWVIRPQKDEFHDFRGFAGQVAGGAFRVGDPVIALPSGIKSKVKEIYTVDGSIEVAYAQQSVTLLLEDEIDISRGDMIVHQDNLPYQSTNFEAMVCWMHDQPMNLRRKYFLKHTTRSGKCMIKSVDHRVDIEQLEIIEGVDSLKLNEIGQVSIQCMTPIIFDRYQRNRYTGGFILIDEATNVTVAAGMICEPNKAAPVPEYDDYVI